jgi:hypothetical protein
MTWFKKWLDGFRLLGSTYVTPRSYHIGRARFAAEEKNMAADFCVLGSDWAKTLGNIELNHGKTNTRQSRRYEVKSAAIGTEKMGSEKMGSDPNF